MDGIDNFGTVRRFIAGLRDRVAAWWGSWLVREIKAPRPGGFPQAFYAVNTSHPRTVLVRLLKRDPDAYAVEQARERERAFRRRGYTGRF